MNPPPFQAIAGHEAILGSLTRALRENRLSPALLFHGPAGVGKLTAALAFCRALLCEKESPGACGECGGCRRIGAESLKHPDIGLLWPQSKEDFKKEQENPPATPRNLHLLQDEARRNAGWSILIDPVRSRLGELHLTPSLGRRRILLILAAERLGDSGNTLLKVLEEPPGGAVLILLTENASALLPTIRSRCQICRFTAIPRAELERHLRERCGIPATEARQIAPLAGGRIGSALSLAKESGPYRSRRDLLARIFGEVRRERTAAVCLGGAREITGKEDDSSRDLAILANLVRDAMMAGGGAEATLLVDPEGAEGAGTWNLPPLEAARCLGRIERAREDLRRRVNRQVALETLLLDLSGADPSGPIEE